MPLDPRVRELLDLAAAAGLPPTHTLTPDQARFYMLERRKLTAGPPEPVARVDERTIDGPGGPLALRVYAPGHVAALPVLVYFHGGGWVVGNLDTHDPVCRSLANDSGCLVVSVDYRLAPETKYPGPAEDCYAATAWVAAHARELGGDPGRLAVGGDSAGGNLAAAVALMARDRGGPRLGYQLLIYPVTDRNFETASYRANAEGYMLTREAMAWYWDHYLPDAAAAREPYAAPLQAPDLRGLPPALVVTAEYDPLADEGRAYADRLAQAGVPTVGRCYPGLIHGFFGLAAALPAAREAIREAGRDLRAGLAGA